MRLALPQRLLPLVVSGTMLFSSLLPASAAYGAPAALQDIADSYAHKEIQALVEAGIVGGYEDGSFRPEADMTRAELSKIIALTAGLTEQPDQASSYTDVATDSWYRGFVGALVAAGITQGTSSNQFSPNDQVTREELVVFFIRAMGLAEKAQAAALQSTAFADWEEVAEWAKPAVALASQIGFIQGSKSSEDGSVRFMPRAYAQRQALARLAYEFRTNRAAYEAKAKLLLDAKPTESQQVGSSVESMTAPSSTTVEVTFKQDVDKVKAEDFTFDHNLKVTNAVLKSGSKRIVVLTTSTQTGGTSYTLTYLGRSTDIRVTGAASFFGGGGGGSSSGNGGGSSNDGGGSNGGGGGGGGSSPTVAQQLASGTPQTELTVSSSGTYGPESGTRTTVQRLIIDPGPTGEVTLLNINPEVLEIRSGSAQSVKLQSATVGKLTVAENNQQHQVRVALQAGANVNATEVRSKAILEGAASDSSFGPITVTADAAGKPITLRGGIDSEITVEAAGATVTMEPPSVGNSVQTNIKKLKLNATADLKLQSGTVLESVYVNAAGIAFKVDGPGAVQALQVSDAAAGASIELGSGSNVSKIHTSIPVALTGDTEAAAKVILEGSGSLAMDEAFELEVKNKTILLAVEAMSAALQSNAGYSELLQKYIAADSLIAKALSLGASESTFGSLISYKLSRGYVYGIRDTLAAVKLKFAEGDSASSVTQKPTFIAPTTTTAVVAWSSSHPALSYWSPLHRPARGEGDAEVTLTAQVYNGPYVGSKSFTVTVKELESQPHELISLRSDLVLVVFDDAVANPTAAEYSFDGGLQVLQATHYPQYPNLVVLNVSEQTNDKSYALTWNGAATGKLLTGSTSSVCSASLCVIPNSNIGIPVPGVMVPGIIYGQVKDINSKPVQGATVTLSGTNLTTTTGYDGYFRFEEVPSGVTYTVKVNKSGYAEASSESLYLASGQPLWAPPLWLISPPEAVSSYINIYYYSAQRSVSLFWSPPSGYGLTPTTFKVYKNGELAIETSQFYIAVEGMEPMTTYTFAVEACNVAGCSAKTTVTYTTPTKLKIINVRPYDSVSQTVYAPLQPDTQAESLKYNFPAHLESPDALLVQVADATYSSGQTLTKGALVPGTFEVSSLSWTEGVNEPLHHKMEGSFITIEGATYLLFKPLKEHLTANRFTLYTLFDLKYNWMGQQYEVDYMSFNVELK
ncbi:S-layer homology domain-containing protein [Paenibacillus sp. YYML68]|uniref:S-layer homology domain-containing protein n=1 Tax=Paenibacillus sp. YYML68 TaxID=2909250 RepID=UPI002493A247|nr:S-layer homology domain-containing protein [Paenibacillus sp. YYML68]